MAQIKPLLPRYLGKAQRVRRRAEKDRHLVLQKEVQACDAAHSAPGKAEVAEPDCGIERSPKSEEGPEGKREEQPIARTHSRDLKDLLPAGQNPVPAFRRIEPAEWAAVGSGCL